MGEKRTLDENCVAHRVDVSAGSMLVAKVYSAFEPDERVVAMCSCRGHIFIATDRRLYRLDDGNDDMAMRLQVVQYLD